MSSCRWLPLLAFMATSPATGATETFVSVSFKHALPPAEAQAFIDRHQLTPFSVHYWHQGVRNEYVGSAASLARIVAEVLLESAGDVETSTPYIYGLRARGGLEADTRSVVLMAVSSSTRDGLPAPVNLSTIRLAAPTERSGHPSSAPAGQIPTPIEEALLDEPLPPDVEHEQVLPTIELTLEDLAESGLPFPSPTTPWR